MPTFAPGAPTLVDATGNHALVAALANGGFVLAWFGTINSGPSYGWQAQQFDANGAATGSAQALNSSVDSVLGTSDGGYIIAYTADDGSQDGVYTQKYSSANQAVGDAVLVNATTAGRQYSPTLIAEADGGYAVTYSSTDLAYPDYYYLTHIYQQRYDSLGAASGPAIVANTTVIYNYLNAKTTTLADGTSLISWVTQNPADSFKNDIFTQHVDANGHLLGAEQSFKLVDNGGQSWAVAALADGGYTIAWNDADGLDVVFQKFDANGAKIGDTNYIFTESLHAIHVAAVGLDGGGSELFWTGFTPSGPNYNDYILTEQLNSNSQIVGALTVLGAPSILNQTSMNIATLNDGSYVVTWDGAGIYDALYKIQPSNHNPVGIDHFASTPYGHALTTSAEMLLAGASDADNDPVTFDSVSNVQHGRVKIDSSGNAVFTPYAGFTGDASYTYTISDGLGGTTNLTMHVNVTGTTPAYLYFGNETVGKYIDVSGDGANHSVLGSSHDDIIVGGAGNDSLNGGVGNDQIVGGAGNDILNAGAGTSEFAQYLEGDAGNDNFVFNKADIGYGNQTIIWGFDGAGDGYHSGTGDIITFNGFSASATFTIEAYPMQPIFLLPTYPNDPPAHYYLLSDGAVSEEIVIYYAGDAVLKPGDYGFH